MKTSKLVITMLIAVICTGFISCSNNIKIAPEKLAGKWIITWREGYEKDKNGIFLNEWGQAPDNRGIIFSAEGKFTKFHGNNSNWDNGKWVLINDKIILNSISGLKYEYNIPEFSSSRMIMELHEQGYDGYKLYDKVILQKQ